MESVIHQDSPLAEFLEGMRRISCTGNETAYTDCPTRRGKRRALCTAVACCIHRLLRHPRLCAPRALDAAVEDSRQAAAAPAHPREPPWLGCAHTSCLLGACSGPTTGRFQAHALTAYQNAVNARLGRADNQRFIEHFRYLIVASQLLGEQSSIRTTTFSDRANAAGPGADFKVTTISPTGAVLTAATAFTLVWLVHWARRKSGFSKARFVVVLVIFVVVATASYGYVRRQWLQTLRQQAVENASALVTNLQAFEASTSSALALIQEVELVSRGYRLCVRSWHHHRPCD